MDPPGLKTIFNEALERQDGPERAAYLDEACRGETELRRKSRRCFRTTSGSADSWGPRWA